MRFVELRVPNLPLVHGSPRSLVSSLDDLDSVMALDRLGDGLLCTTLWTSSWLMTNSSTSASGLQLHLA